MLDSPPSFVWMNHHDVNRSVQSSRYFLHSRSGMVLLAPFPREKSIDNVNNSAGPLPSPHKVQKLRSPVKSLSRRKNLLIIHDKQTLGPTYILPFRLIFTTTATNTSLISSNYAYLDLRQYLCNQRIPYSDTHERTRSQMHFLILERVGFIQTMYSFLVYGGPNSTIEQNLLSSPIRLDRVKFGVHTDNFRQIESPDRSNKSHNLKNLQLYSGPILIFPQKLGVTDTECTLNILW